MDGLTERYKYEFNIEEGYLVISEECYSTFSNRHIGDRTIYLHKEDVLWVINTIRSFKKELYNRGSDRIFLRHSEKDIVMVCMGGSDADRQYYGDVEICCKNTNSDYDTILIPYYGPAPMAPSGEGEGISSVHTM